MSTPICEKCKESMKKHSKVKRILKGPRGAVEWKYIYVYRCSKCGHCVRKLPRYIMPYKHYSRDIIEGVIEGLITECTYGFEDYPCEMTMKRWKSTQFLQDILWSKQ